MKIGLHNISSGQWILGSFFVLLFAVLYAVYDNSTWHKTQGRITFVKQIDVDHYLYALEFDSSQGHMKIYNHDAKEPYLKQRVPLSVKQQGDLKVKILYPLKYKHHP